MRGELAPSEAKPKLEEVQTKLGDDELAGTIREELAEADSELPADRNDPYPGGLLVEQAQDNRAEELNELARTVERVGGVFDQVYETLDEAEAIMQATSEAQHALWDAANALGEIERNAESVRNDPRRSNRDVGTVTDAIETVRERLDDARQHVDNALEAMPSEQAMGEAFQKQRARRRRQGPDEFDF